MWPGISRGLEPNPIQLCFTVIILPRDTQCNIVKSAPQNAGHATGTLAAVTMGVSELKRQVRVRTYYFVLIWYNIKLTLLFIFKLWRLAESMHTYTYRKPYRNLGNVSLWNVKSWALESGIGLKESGIPLTAGIQNPSSTVNDWNPELTARNPESKTVLDSLPRGDT